MSHNTCALYDCVVFIAHVNSGIEWIFYVWRDFRIVYFCFNEVSGEFLEQYLGVTNDLQGK